jgi:hypothetical protein
VRYGKATRDAERSASRERDQVLGSIPGWTDPASERVKALINALYEEKVAAAQTRCDKECEHAEKLLKQKLAQLKAGCSGGT